MERVWIIAACMCAVVAGAFLWRGNIDGAFVCGALGLVAWFLDVRNRLTQANAARENASKLESNDIGEPDED